MFKAIVKLMKYSNKLNTNLVTKPRYFLTSLCSNNLKNLHQEKNTNLIEDDFALRINNVPVRHYLNEIIKEYNNSTNKTNLESIVNILQHRKKIIDDIESLQELLLDEDESIRKLASEDKESYSLMLKDVEQELLSSIIPSSEEDECHSIILEINAGVGGQEAMLFAQELFQLYSNFIDYKGWEKQISDYGENDIGGIRHGCFLVNGNSSFQLLKHEAGVHRVQRIPTTEKSGRIHTSTVSVVVLPQPTDIQIKLDPKDLKIETKRASGAGGQHVNTTDSAVRIIHLPTGLSTEVQVDRSQIKNRQIAMIKLRTILYQRQMDEQMAKSKNLRKSQVRTNYRNEKIRTYNFSQDRISDHRIQGENVHNIKGFFEGSQMLENLILKLEETSRIERLMEMLHSVNQRVK